MRKEYHGGEISGLLPKKCQDARLCGLFDSTYQSMLAKYILILFQNQRTVILSQPSNPHCCPVPQMCYSENKQLDYLKLFRFVGGCSFN